MKINTNNNRNISTNFDLPNKFRLLNEQNEIPYLQTGKRSFRLLGDIPEYLNIEEIQEVLQPKKIVKPMQIKSQQMAVINPNDVLLLNQVAQDLELEQNVLNEKQKDLENKQVYLDIQNQNLLQNIENVKQLETDNLQRIEENKNSLVNLAYEIGKTNELVNSDFTTSVNLIEEHKQAVNPHNITKLTVGLDKVDNTSDIDKPISKAVEIALEDKADKQDVEDIKTEIEVYKKKADRIDRGLANFTGGIGGNELPVGGLEGQVLAKKTDKTGDYEWIDVSGGGTGGTTDHTRLKNRDKADQHPITAITGLQEVITTLQNEDIILKSQIDANADAILKTRNDLQAEIDDNAGDITVLQADTTTIKNDLNDLGDQVAGIEEKIPETASGVNQLADKDYVDNAIKSELDNKVSKTGDTMSGNLEMTNGSLYLCGIGGSVAGSTSKLVLGTPGNEFVYLTGNTSKVFGIYTGTGSSRKGIACYPGTSFFADANSKSTTLGRPQNLWQTCYTDRLSNGSVSAETRDIVKHISDVQNPHKVTAEQVGLGNVDNTSDADKPLSTATQNSLQNIRADFMDADTDLQTQINGQATAINDLREQLNNIGTGGSKIIVRDWSV